MPEICRFFGIVISIFHNAAKPQPKKLNHKEYKVLHKDHKENLTKKEVFME